jgi:hypothetical protein
MEDDYWDFWEQVDVCGGYESEEDRHLVEVFIETGKGNSWYADIASKLELDKSYVLLLMEILSGANFCEYGTSPRSAWAVRSDYKENVERLLNWYKRKWSEDVFPVRNEVTGSEIK